jgi:DNA-binding transcriptional MerR regulator
VGWSTREIAELAGTSLRAVRHYHEVGLLEEPERRANGYKQYGVAHLVRVLRITRLADLGFSLPQIAAMGPDDDRPEKALRVLDAELATTIERLQRVRVDLGLIRRSLRPTGLSGVDRSLLVVLAQVLGPSGLQTVADLLQNPRLDPATAEFDRLPGDADDRTREDVARRLACHVRALHADHPGLAAAQTDGPGGAARTIATALQDLYNPAQLDVLERVRALLDD